MRRRLTVACLAALVAACSPPEPAPTPLPASNDAAPAAAPAATADEAAAPAPAAAAETFDRRFDRPDGIGFAVHAEPEGEGTRVTITPLGMSASNEPVTQVFAATVTGAESDDLDADGFPEVYVYLSSTDGSRRGDVFAVASNKGKSASSITLPALADVPANAEGYTGGDEFAVLEGVLARRFPVQGADGASKTRQLQYTLVPGEAGWQLKLDRTSEF